MNSQQLPGRAEVETDVTETTHKHNRSN